VTNAAYVKRERKLFITACALAHIL